MKYCVTVEETRRAAVWFEADNDAAAEAMVEKIIDRDVQEQIDSGSCDIERDYALDNVDVGATVIPWK